jgi:hypothetical protein
VIEAYSRFGSFPGTRTSKNDWNASAVRSGSDSSCEMREVSHMIYYLRATARPTMMLGCFGEYATPESSTNF